MHLLKNESIWLGIMIKFIQEQILYQQNVTIYVQMKSPSIYTFFESNGNVTHRFWNHFLLFAIILIAYNCISEIITLFYTFSIIVFDKLIPRLIHKKNLSNLNKSKIIILALANDSWYKIHIVWQWRGIFFEV